MKKGLALILVLFMLVSALAACKGDGEDTTASTNEPSKTMTQDIVDNAAGVIYEYNKPGIDNSVTTSFKLPTKYVDVDDNEFDITWEAVGGNGHVTVEPSDNNSVNVVIGPDAVNGEEFTIKGTVKNGEFSKDIEMKYVTKVIAATDVLEEAYKLAVGESLDGSYTLSGTITVINTPYSDEYKNITVTIVVDGYEDKPVQCYRLKGEGADTIKKNDKITVTGSLKNYSGTIEFDAGCTLDSIDFVSEDTAPKLETPEQIVKALYALNAGEALDGGPYTLSGTITDVPTPYDAGYNNVTVVIVADGLTEYPVTCYRLKGDGADTIKTGDKITVSGYMKRYNDTFEFDAGCTIVSIDEIGDASTETTPDTEADTTPASPDLDTPEKIINTLYALKDGETIDGEYTLTGKITAVNTKYSDQYKNVTVTIVVDGFADKPVQCFRLKGDGADTIAEGDTITVTGGLKNYKGTFEFNEGCNLDKVVKGSGTPEETTTKEETTAPSDDPTPKTPKEIVEAAYALGKDKALDGTWTLSGTVTAVNTPYSEEFKNVTVTITVDGCEDKPIQCFRMKGTDADKVKKNDKITVTGKLKNYNGTIEFDAGCTLDKIDFVSEDTSPKLETPEQIVKALYALNKNEALEGGPYTLTGKITSIPTPYDSGYNNVTVVIVCDGLDDYPVTCYRLKGDGADTIKVGDTITVKGNMKRYNDTFEFDSGCTIVK